MGFCGDVFLGARALHRCLRPLWQNFASSGDIGCGEAAWPDILTMAAACEHYLLKLKLAVVACIVQASHPIEQNYLIQWAIGGIFPPQVFPARSRHPQVLRSRLLLSSRLAMAEEGLQTQLPLPPPPDSPPADPTSEDDVDEQGAKASAQEEVDWGFGEEHVEETQDANDAAPDNDAQGTKKAQIDAANADADWEDSKDTDPQQATIGASSSGAAASSSSALGNADSGAQARVVNSALPRIDKSHIAGLSLPLESLIPAPASDVQAKRPHRSSRGQVKSRSGPNSSVPGPL